MLWTKRRKRMPQDGECRTRSRFLWWPMCIRGVCRWLERAKWIERYDTPDWLGTGGGWHKTGWVDGGAPSKEDNSDD